MAKQNPNIREVNVSQDQLPAWVSEAGQDLYGSAVDVVNQPTPTYDGPRIAGFTPEQEMAFQSVTDRQGATAPIFDQAHNMFSQAGQGYGTVPQIRSSPVTSQQIGDIAPVDAMMVSTDMWDAGAMDRYMNPYIQGVLDPAISDIRRESGITTKNLGSKAATVGALGSKRHGVALAENARDSQELINKTIGDLRYRGYEGAQGMFTSDMGRKLTADTSNQSADLSAKQGNQRTELERQRANQSSDLDAQRLSMEGSMFDTRNKLDQFNRDADRKIDAGSKIVGLGKDAYDIARTDTQDLFNVGEIRRGLDQEGLDLAYGDYLDEKNDPYEKINFLSGVLSGTPYERKTVTDQVGGTQTKGPSTLSQIVGGAASIASMFI